MKTIYNTYVVMTDQSMCDRMKSLCIDNGLPIWECGFTYINELDVFGFADDCCLFFILASIRDCSDHTQVTEQEFIELLKTTK